MNRPRLGLAAAGWLALAATALPAGSPPRVIVTFAFVLICPGAATVRLAQAVLRKAGSRPMDPLESFVLAVALSLSLGALVSEALFLAQGFTTARAIFVLAVFTSIAALCPVRGSREEHGTSFGFPGRGADSSSTTSSSEEPR